MQPPSQSPTVKVVLLGASQVGKTCMALRFCSNTFAEGLDATIGASFLNHKVTLGNQTLLFQIWDTAGQERFESLIPMYYRTANIAVIVYDVSDLTSLDRAKAFVQKIIDECQQLPLISFVGNKCDIEQTEWQVNEQEVIDYCLDSGYVHKLVSARTNHGIDALFDELGTKYIEKMKEQWEKEQLERIEDQKRISAQQIVQQQTKKKGECC